MPSATMVQAFGLNVELIAAESMNEGPMEFDVYAFGLDVEFIAAKSDD